MGSICNKSPNVIEAEKPKDPDNMIPSAYHYDLRKTYQFIKILNHGAFGQVKLFTDKTFKEAKFAIKTITKDIISNEKKFNHIRMEIEILSQLDHPNIVNYYSTIETPNNFNIIMEYLGGKSFLKLITEERHKFSLENFRLILYQVLSALCYLHGKDIIHRDIKPENILCSLEENYEVKLIDFGLSSYFRNKYDESSAGSPDYMAPEAFNGKLTPKNDIWSIGIIYYIYCFGKFPFNCNNEDELCYNLQNNDIDFENGRLNDIKDEDIILLKKMLDKDYENRINANTAIRDKVFDIVNKHFFNNETIDKYLDEFFSENTLKLITKYVESNIIKKTFIYMFIWLSPFHKRHYYKRMFVAVDNYFNYSGYLKSREVFEEFKGRDLIDEEGGKIFSFIDSNRSNKAKHLFKIEESSIEEESDDNKKKSLSRSASSKSLKYKDWGIITYSIFLSFFYIEDIKELKNDESKIKYLFRFFCDRPLCDNPKKEIVDINGNVISTNYNDENDNPETMTKTTFMRFCYKQNLPFKDAEDDINKFFAEHPNPINFKEFKNLMLSDNDDNCKHYNDSNENILGNGNEVIYEIVDQI